MASPCPIIKPFVDCVVQKNWPIILNIAEVEQEFEQPNAWEPVLDTRAAICALSSLWQVVYALCSPQYHQTELVQELLKAHFDDLRRGEVSRLLERAQDPALLITTDFKLVGSPRDIRQILVESAQGHLELIKKVATLADSARALLEGRLLFPKLPIGDQFAAVLLHVHTPVDSCLHYARRLLSITKENQAEWRKKTVASLALPGPS